MKVVAIKPAFFNGTRIRVGAEVEIPDNLKGSWFAKVDSPVAKATKAVKPKEEPKALSQLPKGEGKSFIDAHAGDGLA